MSSSMNMKKNLSAVSDVKVVDLTGDDVQKEQELHNLKQEAVVTSEALQNSLAEIVFNEEQSIKYKEEVVAEKKKLAQELSESSKANGAHSLVWLASSAYVRKRPAKLVGRWLKGT